MNTPLLTALIAIYGKEAVLTDPAEVLVYGYDNSRLLFTPDIVVFATQAKQIQDTVALCITHQAPLTARGRGTATTGAALPRNGGVVLSLEHMNSIITIDPDNRYAIVQPGVTNQALQEACKPHNLFWGPNPTSAAFCSIGGNLACNAAGSASVKYGTTRDNVLGCQFVSGTGALINAGKPVTKLSAGYDLTRLLIGSEGTLGIITEATLKLTPLAETSKTLRILYQDSKSAAQGIVALMQQSNTPSALEFLDQHCVAMVKDTVKDLQAYPDATMLLVKVDSSKGAIDGDIQALEKCTQNPSRLDFTVAHTQKETQALWQARKVLSPKLKEIAPKKINEDVVVPIANIPDLLAQLEILKQKHDITIVNFGHAGNGNIHVNLLIDPDDASQVARAEKCLHEIFTHVIALDGAISGEHGIGIAKQDFLDLELSPESRVLMGAVKKAFDPHNILNPDKGFHHINTTSK